MPVSEGEENQKLRSFQWKKVKPTRSISSNCALIMIWLFLRSLGSSN